MKDGIDGGRNLELLFLLSLVSRLLCVFVAAGTKPTQDSSLGYMHCRPCCLRFGFDTIFLSSVLFTFLSRLLHARFQALVGVNFRGRWSHSVSVFDWSWSHLEGLAICSYILFKGERSTRCL